MANRKSAAKRARQNKVRAMRNTNIRSRVKGAVRGYHEALSGGDADKLKTALTNATREIRRAAAAGVLHKATASRRVSRLVLAFNKSK